MGSTPRKRKYVTKSIRFKLYFEDLPKKAKHKRVVKDEISYKRRIQHPSSTGVGGRFRSFVRRIFQ